MAESLLTRVIYSPVRAQIPSGCCVPSAEGLREIGRWYGRGFLPSPQAERDVGVFCFPFFFLFVRGDGEVIGVLRLVGRALHVFVGGVV